MATKEICAEIISEYDTDADQKLSLEEFQNMVLPAANEAIRSFVLQGS